MNHINKLSKSPLHPTLKIFQFYNIHLFVWNTHSGIFGISAELFMWSFQIIVNILNYEVVIRYRFKIVIVINHLSILNWVLSVFPPLLEFFKDWEKQENNYIIVYTCERAKIKQKCICRSEPLLSKFESKSSEILHGKY